MKSETPPLVHVTTPNSTEAYASQGSPSPFAGSLVVLTGVVIGAVVLTITAALLLAKR
jgi:hypothetical protein